MHPSLSLPPDWLTDENALRFRSRDAPDHHGTQSDSAGTADPGRGW